MVLAVANLDAVFTSTVIETLVDPLKLVEPVASPVRVIVRAVCNLLAVEAFPFKLPVISPVTLP